MAKQINDKKDLEKLLDWLKENGKEYTIDDSLVDLLGSERFCYDTRRRAVEASFIIRDNPELKKLITPDIEKYFEPYNL